MRHHSVALVAGLAALVIGFLACLVADAIAQQAPPAVPVTVDVLIQEVATPGVPAVPPTYRDVIRQEPVGWTELTEWTDALDGSRAPSTATTRPDGTTRTSLGRAIKALATYYVRDGDVLVVEETAAPPGQSGAWSRLHVAGDIDERWVQGGAQEIADVVMPDGLAHTTSDGRRWIVRASAVSAIRPAPARTPLAPGPESWVTVSGVRVDQVVAGDAKALLATLIAAERQ